MKYLFTLLLLLFFNSQLFAAQLDGRSDAYNDFSMQITSGATEFAMLKDAKWDEAGNYFTLGYAFKPFWFKTVVTNSSDKAAEYFFEFSEPFSEECDFYVQDANGLHITANGLHVPVGLRSIKSPLPTIALVFAPHESKTVYVHYSSRFTSYGSFAFYTHAGLDRKNILYEAFYFFYFGAVVIMVLYNTVLYFFLKERSYIYYVGYAVSFGLWVFLFSGFSLYLLDKELHYALHFSTALSLAFFSLFSLRILEVKKNFPAFYRPIKIVTWLLLFSSALTVFWLETGYMCTNMLGQIFFPIFLVLGFLAVKRNIKVAKFYMFALTLFMLSMVLISNTAMGTLPLSAVSKYSFVIGSLVEIALFSLILAYRINILRQEKYESQSELLFLKQNEALRLELTVAEKTVDLNNANKHLLRAVAEKELLLKEVYHRVKNNLQTIISLLWLQQQTSSSEETIKLMLDNSNRIKSIALVHELLYSSDSLAEISSKEYIFKLQKALSILSQHEIRFIAKLSDIGLDIDTAICIGTIIVEAVTNSIKHAFSDTQTPKIWIIFCHKETKAALIIRDNGLGFDEDNAMQKSSLGLKLIKQSAERLNNCTCMCNNAKGALLKLEFDYVSKVKNCDC